MQAIKLNARVDCHRRLSLQLPAEVPEGEVEVIILAPSAGALNDRRRHLETLLGKLETHPRPRLSKSEIDAYLAQERVSWERSQPAMRATPVVDDEGKVTPTGSGER